MVTLAVIQRTAPRARLQGAVLRVVTGVVAAAICAGAVAIVASAAPAEQRFLRALTEALIIGLPVAVGLYATSSPRTVRFGRLLIGAGFVWALTALAESSESLPYSIGRVAAWLIFPVLVYLALAYPGGRIATGIDRRLFGGVALVVGVLYVGSALFVEAYPLDTPWASCTTDCPPNAFFVLNSQPAFIDDVITPLREGLGVVLLVGVSLSLVRRFRAAAPLRRQTIGPLMVMSVASTAGLAVFFVARRVDPGSQAVTTIAQIWSLTVPGVAAAFLIGLVRRRIMVGQVLTRLSLGLSPLNPRE